jgi:hypothetical protein
VVGGDCLDVLSFDQSSVGIRIAKVIGNLCVRSASGFALEREEDKRDRVLMPRPKGTGLGEANGGPSAFFPQYFRLLAFR